MYLSSSKLRRSEKCVNRQPPVYKKLRYSRTTVPNIARTYKRSCFASMMLLLGIVLVFLCSQQVHSFKSWKYHNCPRLSMVGGRSPTEKKVSSRGMFKDLREKLNTAAEVKGFFEVGEGPVVST